MAVAQQQHEPQVKTVLGPVSPNDLGVVAFHESLLSVVPGAQYAFDITINRAEIFDVLFKKLQDFRNSGGGTIVDSTGMFHGRDLRLYEALSRTTGVNIVASTGMGPEDNLGGYFLTPQTNPPTPWPAEKFSDLFTQEAREGMVLPRLERRAPAGLIATAADRKGITATEVSLFKGAARSSMDTGLAVSIRYGNDALSELNEVLAEGLPANRVVVGDLDRTDAGDVAAAVAEVGAYVALDHVGWNSHSEYIDDDARIELIKKLIESGFDNRIIISSNATGVAKGFDAVEVSYSYLLDTFVPSLIAAGVSEKYVAQILEHNPRELLTVSSAIAESGDRA